MKNALFGAVAAALLSTAGSVNAATISLSVFDIGSFNNAINGSNFIIQDFEGHGAGVVGPSLGTDVGDFSSLGGMGTGSTCIASLGGPNCTELAIFDTAPNSQGSLVPTDGTKSLNSNDTLGILWDVATGNLFNRVVFAMTDAGDQGASVTITADGTSSPVTFDLTDGNEKLVVIDFGGLVSGATVQIASGQVNDGLAIDGASVGVVPLPATGLLLLGGLGALGAMRRRQKS